MNHPTPEELAEFLYDEADATKREEISNHLASCETCAARIASWRTVRKELAGWNVPTTASRTRRAIGIAQPLRWAAAAIVFLCVGYGLARLTSPSIDPTKLRAELAKEVRQEIASEMTHYSDQQLAQQAEFQQAVAASINRLAVQQVTDHATLRKDVETVALRTQEEFARLATVDHPAATGTNPSDQ